MKKIINKLGIAVIAGSLLVGCGNKKDDKQVAADAAAIQPQYYVGIGKIVPDGGLSSLSVTQANKVTKVFKKIGDTVRAGDVLFEMDAVDENLQVAAGRAAVQTAQATANASKFDIQNAELKLAELKKEFELSKQLLLQKAETQQKVTQDSIAYLQQKVAVAQARSNYLAQSARVEEQNAQLAADKSRLNKQAYKAIQDGVLTRFDVVLGSLLNPNEAFGELAPIADLVVEGEIDELYAAQIKQGQKVSILLVGQQQEIATGIISFVGASLQNKSIMYETVGEANDRRVRRFTVQISNTNNTLLINQKVECKILL